MPTLEHYTAEYEGQGLPKEWAEAFGHMLNLAKNPPEKIKQYWPGLIDKLLGTVSLNIFQIIESGWSLHDIFGCHGTAPGARYGDMGLLMLLNGCTITKVEPEAITIQTDRTKNSMTFRPSRHEKKEQVFLWQIK